MPIYRPEYFQDGVYHIYNRGVAKLATFLHDDDYHDFQDILRYLLIGFPKQKVANLLKGEFNFPVSYKADPLSNGLFKPLIDLIAYCLMPNHFHLLIQIKQPVGQKEFPDGRIATFHVVSELLRLLCITYSHKFNHRHGREGAVFQGRFKIKHIPNDMGILQVARYIHLNPVVASLVSTPVDWLFSDYNLYIVPGSFRSLQITNTQLILSYFDGKPERYKEFVRGAISDPEVKIIAQYIIDQEDEQA